MKGVSFVTDHDNNKLAIQIDMNTLLKHEDEIIDMLDVIIAESRKDEPKVSWEKVKKNLIKKGKLKQV